MKQFFCFLWAIIGSLNLYSQNTKIIIDNQTPGRLSSKLTYSQKQVVEDLTITGYVNQTDMAFVNGLIRNFNLKTLDLSNVNPIVDDKEYFLWTGFLSFGSDKILQKVRLPLVVEGVHYQDDNKSVICSKIDSLEIGWKDFSVVGSIWKTHAKHLILLDGVYNIPYRYFMIQSDYDGTYYNSTIEEDEYYYVSLSNTIKTIGGRAFGRTAKFSEPFTFPDSIIRIGRHPLEYDNYHGNYCHATENSWCERKPAISNKKFAFPKKMRYYNSLDYESNTSGGTRRIFSSDEFTSDTIVVYEECDTLFAKINAKVGYFYNEEPVKFWSPEDVKIDLLYVPVGCLSAYNDAYPNVKNIKEFGVGNTTITMGSSGIATYSNNSDLNFTGVSGLKAYIGSGYNPATGNLTMTRVYEVPAGEGLILKGAADSYEVPYEETSAYYANLLVGVPTATTVSSTDGSYTNFILANDAVKGIGFYPLASAGEVGPNKAYLQLPTSILPAASRSLRMVFEDEEDVTGVNALNDKLKMINDKAVYDLQGRRVVKPTRGLYIKDGKKIMVK